MTSPYMTAADVAAMFHITKRAVYKWRLAGRGPKSFHAEGRLLFERKDVEAYAKNRPRRGTT